MATRTINTGLGRIVEVVRTSERPLCYSYTFKEYATRNIWVAEDGRTYVWYKGEFYRAIRTDEDWCPYSITLRASCISA